MFTNLEQFSTIGWQITQFLQFDLVALTLIQIGDGLLIIFGGDWCGCCQNVLKSAKKRKNQNTHTVISHIWVQQDSTLFRWWNNRKMENWYITTTQFTIILMMVGLIACHLMQTFKMNLIFFGVELKDIDIFRVHANNFLVTLTSQYPTTTERIQFIYEFCAAFCECCRVTFAALCQHRRYQK